MACSGASEEIDHLRDHVAHSLFGRVGQLMSQQKGGDRVNLIVLLLLPFFDNSHHVGHNLFISIGAKNGEQQVSRTQLCRGWSYMCGCD